MRKQYIEVPLAMRCRGLRSNFMRLKGNLLGPIYWLAALIAGGPGLMFHAKCFWLGVVVFVTRCLKRGSYNLMFFPMDSTRYFEFHETWKRLYSLPFKRYLDVSSPRLLPFMLMRSNVQASAELINPDPDDIRNTEKFFTAFRINNRCRLNNCTIAQAVLEQSSFDLITCLSVLEHIPSDREAVSQMWSLLKPGSDGYTFWQRYYDAGMLQETIFDITGRPVYTAIYGEKTNGLFFRNATMKRLMGGRYPFWREPYMMATEYRYFQSVEELPGEGVVYLEFIKR